MPSLNANKLTKGETTLKNRYWVGLACGVMMLGVAGMANAAIIDFDDVDPGGSLTWLDGSSYRGFNWDGGWSGESWVVSPKSAGYFDGDNAHSGNNFAWNNGGTELYLSSDDLFDFISMWTRSGPVLVDGMQSQSGFINNELVATGFKNSAEIYSQYFSLSEDYQLVSFNFLGVDRVTLSAHYGNSILIDDITVNTGAGAGAPADPVPEPATILLLGTGLAGLAGTRLRRKRQ